MIQTTLNIEAMKGLHVAIIMDGSGRWATARGLARSDGHVEGARAVRRTVEAAVRLGLGTLTLFAFSSDNWRRPAEEVQGLMRLFGSFLASEAGACRREGVRLSVMGRRDRLPPELARAVVHAEKLTGEGARLHLRLAVDYSSRDSLLAAAGRLAPCPSSNREALSEALGTASGGGWPSPDVDLLIRTGGERRLSDFLLWECAYAELLFLDLPWPDFGERELRAALEDFARRERRFGGLAPAPPSSLAAGSARGAR